MELVDRQDTALFSLTVHSQTLMSQIQTVFRDPSFVEKLMGFNITKRLLLYYFCVDQGWFRLHS
jgi:hypothetical protein